jgi:hypothetical protein
MRFLLGETPKGQVTVSPQDLETHMQIIGATKGGKSYFLRNLAEQIMVAPYKPCLIVIDPHGSLYHQLLNTATFLRLDERLVLFDPSDSAYVIGYNPMERDSRELSYQAMMMLEACRKVWGKQTFNETPRLARWLYNAFDAAIEAGLTLREAHLMLEPLEPAYRKVITPKVQNPMVRMDWEWMLQQKPKLMEERVESSLNRFRPFFSDSRIANILTQQKTILKLREIMDRGQILLVNLESYTARIAPEHTQLLGTLLVNDILAAAFSRLEKERSPVYLMIDEFQNFVTKDLCAILDGGRKYGLHLILAHQHPQQLLTRDPEVYYSTLTNARIKVIFGGLSYEDAELLAREAFRFDPKKVKLELYRTFFEPVESTREIISSSHGRVSNIALSSSFASGAVYGPGGAFFDPGLPRSTSEVEAKGESSAYGDSYGEVVTEVPFYEYHESKELASVQFESLDEQLYLAINQLRDQPTQYAAVKIPGREIKFIKVPTLKELQIRDSRMREFKDYVFTETGYYSTIEAVEEERKERRERLLAEAELQSLEEPEYKG